MLRLYSLTLLQDPERYELAIFFYEQIVGCPEMAELGEGYTRFFPGPAYLAVGVGPPPSEEGNPYGGFTGIQLNFVPSKDLNPIVAKQRASGLKQPEPRDLEGQRLLPLHDPSGNILMCVGYDEMPDEPTIEDAIGSITIFVEDLPRSKAFFVDQLELPVRAEPHPGLLVLGAERGTAIMVYQVAPGNPNTPIGRTTGIAFVSADPGEVLSRVQKGGGEVIDKVQGSDPTNGIRAATFSDPDSNEFVLLSETSLVEPKTDQDEDNDGDQ